MTSTKLTFRANLGNCNRGITRHGLTMKQLDYLSKRVLIGVEAFVSNPKKSFDGLQSIASSFNTHVISELYSLILWSEGSDGRMAWNDLATAKMLNFFVTKFMKFEKDSLLLDKKYELFAGRKCYITNYNMLKSLLCLTKDQLLCSLNKLRDRNIIYTIQKKHRILNGTKGLIIFFQPSALKLTIANFFNMAANHPKMPFKLKDVIYMHESCPIVRTYTIQLAQAKFLSNDLIVKDQKTLLEDLRRDILREKLPSSTGQKSAGSARCKRAAADHNIRF